MNVARLRISLLNLGLGFMLLAMSPQQALAVTHDITVGDNFFSPANLTIQVGDTVRWNNAPGGNSHNVTANNGSFSSSTSSSFTFTETFNSAGSFGYTCTLHPSQMNGTITVQSGGGGQEADLSLLSVNAEAGTFAPGDDITVDISIKNVGGQTSAAASITYYASANNSISGSDIELGTDPVAALAANATLDYTANASFPDNIGDGDYFIGAIININDASAGNNVGLDNGTITIESAAVADLSLQSIDAPSGSFEQGESFMVGSTVQNIGAQASGPYTLTFYASTNPQITSQDTIIGSVDRAGLAAGAQDNTDEQVTVPDSLAPGSYYIGGIISISAADSSSNDQNVDNEQIIVTAASSGFLINEGLNDAWFNALTPGQGFFITVFPDIQKMFLAWFTFDTERPPGNINAILGEPGHRWLTAFGPYAGDTASLNVELTQGGVFDAAEPPVAQSADGTIEVMFSGCNAGLVSYDISSAAVSGQVPIERIALDNVPFCEAQAAAQ